jgi:hypothetical protein
MGLLRTDSSRFDSGRSDVGLRPGGRVIAQASPAANTAFRGEPPTWMPSRRNECSES